MLVCVLVKIRWGWYKKKSKVLPTTSPQSATLGQHKMWDRNNSPDWTHTQSWLTADSLSVLTSSLEIEFLNSSIPAWVEDNSDVYLSASQASYRIIHLNLLALVITILDLTVVTAPLHYILNGYSPSPFTVNTSHPIDQMTKWKTMQYKLFKDVRHKPGRVQSS